jgi:molecular chaperone GrpE
LSEDRRETPQGSDHPEEENRPDEAAPNEAAATDEVVVEGVVEEESADIADDPVSTDPSDPSEVPEAGIGEPENMEKLDAESDLSGLVAELEITRRERDDYLDGLRRLKAEFENSRKRMERERERILQTASERLVGELLPVLDNLERALEAEGDVREGVSATRDQLVGVLEREGLTPIDSDGEAFDPAVHEAVMGQPSDEHEDGTILQTFERGYVLNGRAIRPAKVVVARQG